MKKRIIGLVCICAGGLGVLSQIPVAWVAPHILPDGLGTDIQYSGTIWDGNINGLDIVGNTQFQLNPKSLFSSDLPLSFQTSSPVMQLSGQASRYNIKDLNFSGQLAGLPTSDGRLKNLAGSVNIEISELKFNRTCSSANGQASTDILSLNQARWQWKGPFLSGPLRCEDGDIIAELSGAENGQTIQAILRLKIDGAYRADFSVRTPQPEAGVVLPLYGFEKRGSEFHLTEQGKWR